jgi:branched-chain amino acid transport system substrate-binding protein
VTIAAVQTTSGPLAPFGFQVDAGLKDSLAMINAQGGINGKQLVYEMAGGNYNPNHDKDIFMELYSKYKPLVMFGNSTGLGKMIAPMIEKELKILYSSVSFSSELAYSAMFPSVFVAGPTYGDQVGLLLRYIAKEKPGAKVALFYSDTGFGKDPIKFAKLTIKRLRLELVAEQTAGISDKEAVTQARAIVAEKPDYVIIHGFLLDPVPSFIQECKSYGLNNVFMGTFWGATKMILDKLGPLADNYMAVNPYSYWWQDDVEAIKEIKAYTAQKYPDVEYRPIYYMQSYLTGMVFAEILRKADAAGKLNYEGVTNALKSIKDFNTNGLTAPLTIYNNRFPTARIWKANVTTNRFDPVTEWLTLK